MKGKSSSYQSALDKKVESQKGTKGVALVARPPVAHVSVNS